MKVTGKHPHILRTVYSQRNDVINYLESHKDLTLPGRIMTEHGWKKFFYHLGLFRCFPHNVTFVRKGKNGMAGRFISFTYSEMYDVLFNSASITRY